MAMGHSKEMIAKAIRRKKMADGGEVKGSDVNQKNAAEIQKGATKSGYDPKSWAQNFKEGLKMAEGGEVDEKEDTQPTFSMEPKQRDPMDTYLDIEYDNMADKVKKMPEPKNYADGGIANAIMEKRKAQMMAKGGMVEDSMHEDDDFLSMDMDPTEADYELEMRTYPDPDETEDPEMKRKMRISGIMARHYNK